MSGPAAPTPAAPGRIVTFYSYKGGTGRSMALANIAWILAANAKRVLVIDWDLEAPGLHRYFRPFLIDKELTASDGLVDLVMEFADKVIAPSDSSAEDPQWYVAHADITSEALSVEFDEFPTPGKIDFIPAGRQVRSYATRVSSFNWQNFYDRLGGGAFFEAVKGHVRAKYDYILIDSRTGVSDTAGICTVQMPDILVVCFTYNNQSIEGASAVAHSSVEGRQKIAGGADLSPLIVLPVPTRVEQAEQARLRLRQRYARRLFKDLLGPRNPDSYWSSVEVPYVPFHGYEETLAAFTDDAHDPKSVLRALVNVAGHLTGGAVSTFSFPIAPEHRQQVLANFAATPGEAGVQPTLEPAPRENPQDQRVRQAESHFLHLPPTLQPEVARIWKRLVRVGSADAADSKQRVRLRELGASSAVVDGLVQAGLVVRQKDSAGEESVEMTDEALISAWARLRSWLTEDSEFLAWRQKLREPIRDWEANDRKSDFLLRGEPLRVAQQWLRERGADLNEAERDFIDRALQQSFDISAPRSIEGVWAAILRPFGVREGIDFDAVERTLVLPALSRVAISGQTVHIVESGELRVDMLQRLLTANLVIADLSIHNAAVFYELGIRHALRDKQTLILRAAQGPVPFDLQLTQHFVYEPTAPAAHVEILADALRAVLARTSPDSPVFASLPRLTAPDRASLIAVPSDFMKAVESAVREQQRGHLELLAAEARGLTWQVEGLRMVGEAQLRLRAYAGARVTWEAVRETLPSDIEANMRLATIYKRLGNLESSDDALRRAIADTTIGGNDFAEAFALLGSNAKARWQNDWAGESDDERGSTALLSPHLTDAIAAYSRAFNEDLRHFYSGLNALTLLTIQIELATAFPMVWEELFAREDESEPALKAAREHAGQLASAVQLSIDSARRRAVQEGKSDIWLDISAAQIAVLRSEPKGVRHAYRSALKAADQFVIESERRQLEIYRQLDVRRDNTAAALSVFDELARKRSLYASPAATPGLSGRVVVFAGHDVDSPGRPTPRFPAASEALASRRILETLRSERAGDGLEYAIAGGVTASDILFHEACLEAGVPSQLFLPGPAHNVIESRMLPSGWVERLTQLTRVLPVRTLGETMQMPAWLADRRDYTIWARANLWILLTALADRDASAVTVIALWDGQASDGPGGISDLLQRASARGARQVIIPTSLLFESEQVAAEPRVPFTDNV